MNIAVVGGGLAGLAVVWNLLAYAEVSVTLFDARDVGGGASGASTGLLHPFPGKQALRSWQSAEAMQATVELIQIAEKELGSPVAEQNGILRFALSEQQRQDFQALVKKEPGISWRTEEEVCKILPLATPAPALWDPQGMTVYSEPYLRGLWLACERKGAKKEIQEIHSLRELSHFDAIVLAAGAETLRFEECKKLPLRAVKGQALICRPQEKLPFSLLSQGHITPFSDPSLCQVGSTYEREFSSLAPEPEKALDLLRKAALFYPPAKDFEVLEVRSGVRIAREGGYRPFCGKVAPNAWVFTGLGSRGLLYHAWIGKAAAKAIFANRDSLEPSDLYKSLYV